MNLFNINLNRTKEEPRLQDISVHLIRPNAAQPRKFFDDSELLALAESIRENGILQPLVVRKVTPKEYELIAGERRLRAAILAGLSEVPCVLNEATDEQSALFALLENLQRVDLGMFEEARGIARLIKNFGLTQEQTAERLGKRQSTIANKLRLLRLTIEEQDWISHAGLSERHARALLRISDEAIRRQVLSKIVTDKMTVSQAEAYIENILKEKEPAAEEKPKPVRKQKIIVRDLRIFENSIEKAISTMQVAGIKAKSERTEGDDYIEYTVRIPKNEAFKPETVKLA